ncbi:hypothetical protein D3C81_1485320 [compost metagenome]
MRLAKSLSGLAASVEYLKVFELYDWRRERLLLLIVIGAAKRLIVSGAMRRCQLIAKSTPPQPSPLLRKREGAVVRDLSDIGKPRSCFRPLPLPQARGGLGRGSF